MRRPFATILAAPLVMAMLFSPSDRASAFDASCEPELAFADQHLGGRGGEEMREPQLDQPVESLPENAKGKGARADFAASIPVYFHVVSHPDGRGNVTQSQIDAQIRVMNHSFGSSGFTFVLAGVTRTVNEEWYFAGPTTSGEREMKRALSTGAPYALNYYSTTAGPYLGWAYFPGLPDSQTYLDGVVVDWESMVRTSDRYADAYDLGLTAVHEAGHWLGLYHTFQGGCNAKGDHVADTPAQRTPTRGCPIGKDTCPEPGLDPIHNYMDYSYDSCYEEFTPDQGARMQDHFAFFRAPAD